MSTGFINIDRYYQMKRNPVVLSIHVIMLVDVI